MSQELLSTQTKYKPSIIKNYCAILSVQVMLAILGGCESPKTSNQDNMITAEITDTSEIRKLAEKYESTAYEAVKTQDQTIVIPNLLRALACYQQLNNGKKEQIISKNIAIGYYQQGNYPKYLEYIQKALELANEINYEYGIRFANASLGGYHYEVKNQPEIALNKFYLPGREALKNLSNEADKEELQVMYASAIADCYMILKDYEQAKKFRNKSIEMNKKTKDTITDIFINYNMGVAEQEQKNYTEAEKYYLKGFKLSQQQGAKNAMKEGDNYLANLYKILGDNKKAYEYRTEQYDIAQEINNETSSRTQVELETSIKEQKLIEQDKVLAVKEAKITKQEEQKKRLIWMIAAAIIAVFGSGSLAVSYRKGKRKEEKHKLEIADKNLHLEEKNAEVEAVNSKLEEANKELARKNKNITDSINYAKRIQDSFIQHPEELRKLFPQSFMFYQPKDIVSGDFYRFKETQEGKKIIAAVDCTGHGVPGAMLTLIGNNILNEAIKTGKETPGEILTYLSEGIHQQLKQGNNFEGDAIKDAMDIAIFSYDPKTETFEYGGAYNTIYIFKKGQEQTIKPDKRPIGKSVNGEDEEFKSHEYKNQQVTIEPGSTVYLGTDGFADQFGGPKNRKLMKKKLRKLLESLQKPHLAEGEKERRLLTMEEQQEKVKEYFEERKGDNEQTDDVLLIGIKV